MAFPMRWLIRHWNCTIAHGALIASNDNWQHTIIGGIITSDQSARYPEQRPRSGGREGSRQSLPTLPAGNYTAIVRGVNNTTGVALVEVYDLSQ